MVGLPNVGKSSLINSLKRTRVAAVGNAPGVTRSVQEVHLDRNVKLLDSPGMVFASEESAPSIAALRNAVKVEQLEDPVAPVAGIVERVAAKQLMTTYKIPAFDGVDEFLQLVATARGKLKKVQKGVAERVGQTRAHTAVMVLLVMSTVLTFKTRTMYQHRAARWTSQQQPGRSFRTGTTARFATSRCPPPATPTWRAARRC